MKAACLLILILLLVACGEGDHASPPALVLPTIADCDLQVKDCKADLPDGRRLRVRFNDRPVRAMEEFLVDMQVPGGRVVKLVVTGVNMDMGFNEFIVERVGGDVFRAQVLLPICIRQRMTWDLSVYVETGSGLFKVPFRFHTVGRGQAVLWWPVVEPWQAATGA